MRRPQEFLDFPPALEVEAGWGPYRAVVRQVIDGDTIDVLVDLGLQSYAYETLRLRGIDAPERFTPPGKASLLFLRELLPVGTPVVINTHKDPQTFGRYVADVWRVRDGFLVQVAEHLVEHGHARRSPWRA